MGPTTVHKSRTYAMIYSLKNPLHGYLFLFPQTPAPVLGRHERGSKIFHPNALLPSLPADSKIMANSRHCVPNAGQQHNHKRPARHHHAADQIFSPVTVEQHENPKSKNHETKGSDDSSSNLVSLKRPRCSRHWPLHISLRLRLILRKRLLLWRGRGLLR
nr:MAG TPA: hypothetical protein [Caudoviricetes sp.]